MPPSISTSICPFAATTTSGSARSVDDTESSCRPPWFDTTTAAAPLSIARRASSPIRIPFTMIGPDQCSRIHFKSAQVTVDSDNAAPTSNSSIGPLPGITMFCNLGTPPSMRNEIAQPGCERMSGKKGTFANGEPPSSSFIPLRGSRSRIPATGVSTVITSAENPALRARSSAASAAPRPPNK